MASQINLAIRSPVPSPPTVGMATKDFLHQVGSDGAFLECTYGVEGGRLRLLHPKRKSNDGSDKERNLCAVHVTGLPEVSHAYHSKGAAGEIRPSLWTPTAYCA
jgi:hypothetical protein